MNNMDKFFEDLNNQIPQMVEEATDQVKKEMSLSRRDKGEAFLLITTNEFNCLPKEEKDLWTENEYLIMRTCIQTRTSGELGLLKVLLERNIDKSLKLKTTLDVIKNEEMNVAEEYYQFMLEKLL